MIKKNLIGARITLKNVWSGVIKDDPKSIKLYKKLGLDIFEPTKKNATKKESTK